MTAAQRFVRSGGRRIGRVSIPARTPGVAAQLSKSNGDGCSPVLPRIPLVFGVGVESFFARESGRPRLREKGYP